MSSSEQDVTQSTLIYISFFREYKEDAIISALKCHGDKRKRCATYSERLQVISLLENYVYMCGYKMYDVAVTIM